jgi:hypothetical protein
MPMLTLFQDEHSDECVVCGEAGYLLLCETCSNACHHDCYDPPRGDDDGEFYCFECAARREADTVPGIFSNAFVEMTEMVPSVFKLPDAVRDRYKWVHTGAEGAYKDFNDLAATPYVTLYFPLRD